MYKCVLINVHPIDKYDINTMNMNKCKYLFIFFNKLCKSYLNNLNRQNVN